MLTRARSVKQEQAHKTEALGCSPGHTTGAGPRHFAPRECADPGPSLMPFYIVSILLPVIAIVHLVRTGRDMRWIMLIVFLPVAGPLAYLIIEVLPSFRNSPNARKAMR